MIPVDHPRARRRRPGRLAAGLVLLVAGALAAPATGARAAPGGQTLHGVLTVEARGLDAAPLGIASLMLLGIELPAHFAAVIHGLPAPDAGPDQGVFIENSYVVTAHFTLARDARGYHLTDATLDYDLRDETHVASEGGPKLKDHMRAQGVIRFAHGRWQDPPAGWHEKGGPRLALRYDATGHFHLDGELVHPVRVEGQSALESPMGGVRLDGHGDHLTIHGELPFSTGKLPASAGPFKALMKQADSLATHPQVIPPPEPRRWPVHLAGDAIGVSVHAVRTLPLLDGGQVVTWLTVGP